MALIRATPTTAIPTVRQLAGDLARWIKDAGLSASAVRLLESLEELGAYCSETTIDIEVFVEPGIGERELDGAASALAPTLTGAQVAAAMAERSEIVASFGATPRKFRGRVRPAQDPPGQKAGTIRYPVAVWIAASREIAADLQRTFDAVTDDRPIAFVLATGEQPAAPVPSGAWHTERLASRGTTNTVWERVSGTQLGGLVDILRADAAARAIESLTNAFGLLLEQELRGLKAKRALAQQLASRVQQRSQGSPGGELLSDVRSRIQRQFAEFGRGVEDRLQAALGAQTGPIWQAVAARLEGLDDLGREYRSKTISLRIREEDEAELLTFVHEQLAAHCLRDLVAMRDMFGLLSADVEQKLAAAGGPSVTLHFQFLPDERLHRVVQTHVVLQRRYQGELPRPGFFEYVMIARRYQIILFMFVSAFGLSFLRTYREFMIPAAIALLALGALNVVNSVKRERVESSARELEKARELLRGEIRRMFADVQRLWSSTVSQHLSDQLPVITGQLEVAIRDYQSRSAQEVAAERQRLQRQLQTFEAVERRLAAPAKGRDAVANAVAQFRGELRQLVAAGLRPTTRTV